MVERFRLERPKPARPRPIKPRDTSLTNGQTPPKPPKSDNKQLKISLDSLLRARVMRKKSTPITAQDVFALAWQTNLPPKIAPAKIIAQDQQANEALVSWAGNAIPSAFFEGVTFFGYAYLSELAQRPEYRRLTEVIATEMVRKWVRFQAVSSKKPIKEEEQKEEDKTEKIKQLEDEFLRLKVKEVFSKAAAHDGFFGRGHVYIDTGHTEDREELKSSIGDGKSLMSRAKIGKGSIKALRNIEPIWCYPTNYNAVDPLREDWYNPTDWFVMGKQIHATRLLKFVGREVPDILKPAYIFGGLSMSQMAKPYVDIWLRTREAVAELIEAFSIFILHTDLSVATEVGGEDLFRRVQLFNDLRNNAGLMLVNKDTEAFDNVAVPLGSLDQLQAQTQEHMASVSGIPIVKLLGISPHGLNASSEGEIRVWYDWINSFQEVLFRDNLNRVFWLIQLSLWGEIDEEITWTFEPLWALDEKSQAELRKQEADTDVNLINAGVIHPEESRKRIANDPNTPFQGLDVADVPDLKQEEMEGLIPKGGSGAVGKLFEEETGAPAERGEGAPATQSGGEAPEGHIDSAPGNPGLNEIEEDGSDPYMDAIEADPLGKALLDHYRNSLKVDRNTSPDKYISDLVSKGAYDSVVAEKALARVREEFAE